MIFCFSAIQASAVTFMVLAWSLVQLRASDGKKQQHQSGLHTSAQIYNESAAGLLFFS